MQPRGQLGFAMKEVRDGGELPENKQIYRHWVEVRELGSGASRSLPLGVLTQIHIPRKKNETQKPAKEILQLTDGTDILEAPSLDELAAQLRERYPDGQYERTLHAERDREAEKRRLDAMNNLVRHIVESFVKRLSNEDSEALNVWLKTKEGKEGLQELWPSIVDAYFDALRNPKR
jgi:hypothetical protein